MTKPGPYFIKNQKELVSIGERPKSLKIPRFGMNNANVLRNRFSDQGSNRISFANVFHRCQVIENYTVHQLLMIERYSRTDRVVRILTGETSAGRDD